MKLVAWCKRLLGFAERVPSARPPPLPSIPVEVDPEPITLSPRAIIRQRLPPPPRPPRKDD